jgi:hypothetical protein
MHDLIESERLHPAIVRCLDDMCRVIELWQSEEVSRDVLRNALKEGTRLGKISRQQIQAASKNDKWGKVVAEITDGRAE